MSGGTGDTALPAGERVRRAAVRLAALAQDGLTFAGNDYETERYTAISGLAVELLAAVSGRDGTELAVELGRDSGYATPKVDVRGACFDERERVLLMRERVDGLWSLPGGWADPGDTPTGAVVREVREEAGADVVVTKLVGCWDRDARGHVPPLPVAVVKLFFLCEVRALGEPDALETLETGWFDLDGLPPLSLGRVDEHELRRCLAHHRDPSLPTELD
ncbi:NUDIX hydrolase N-terminal domain-containing protein [Aquipuribacter sp. SD81]|uniref:NUDIX hydrolase N-terminal domain-containing protein n=1 Tax=Aquipuribacter sp. SD81 TaxID=3127703 RepID=UPI003015CF07